MPKAWTRPPCGQQLLFLSGLHPRPADPPCLAAIQQPEKVRVKVQPGQVLTHSEKGVALLLPIRQWAPTGQLEARFKLFKVHPPHNQQQRLLRPWTVPCVDPGALGMNPYVFHGTMHNINGSRQCKTIAAITTKKSPSVPCPWHSVWPGSVQAVMTNSLLAGHHPTATPHNGS